MGKNVVKETKSELKKVIWPNAKAVVEGTIAVTVISAIVGIYVMVADLASSGLVNAIIDAF